MFSRKCIQLVSAVVLLAACGEPEPPVVAVDPCAIESNLISRATFLMGTSPQDAANVLQPCLAKLSPEALTLFKKLTVDAETSRAKAIAAKASAYENEVKAYAAAAKLRKAESRQSGVNIGMTPAEVLGSNWGRPQTVNRTTNQYGVREQWVYGGRNYLYFQDGRLTAIQN